MSALVNGVIYDAASLKLIWPGGLGINLESLDFNDKKDDKAVHGIGGMIIGTGRGKYEGSFTIEIGLFEYEVLNKFALSSGGFYNMPPIVIVASYGSFGQIPITNTIVGRINARDWGLKKGGENLTVKLTGYMTLPMTTSGTIAVIPA